MSSVANYASIPVVGSAQVSVANTLRDGTGTTVTAFTAGVSGSRVDDIQVKAVGTTTAGMIRIFTFDGANTRLLTEIIVDPVTPLGTVKSFEGGITIGQSLPNGMTLKASTHNAETFNITIFGGSF
jgi:hypothetical protein